MTHRTGAARTPALGVGGSRDRSRGRGMCVGLSLVGCLGLGAGCIERTVSINTEPEGAVVVLNDQEVGRSPVRVPFTWYGDYDITIRKEGHKTIHTNHQIVAPWYQWPIIDVFTECLLPFTVHDDRMLETYVLEPAEKPSEDELLERAAAMQREALVE